MCKCFNGNKNNFIVIVIDIDVIKICTNVYFMVLLQNKYKNTLIGVLRTQITFVTHSSLSCYVTLRTQVIRLNSGNLGPQKTDPVFSLFYQSESAHTDRLFIADKTSDLHYDFLSECHLAHTARFFIGVIAL